MVSAWRDGMGWHIATLHDRREVSYPEQAVSNCQGLWAHFSSPRTLAYELK